MNQTVTYLRNLEEYKELYDASKNRQTAAVFGVEAHKAYFPALICDEMKSRCFIIVPDEASARIAYDILQQQIGKACIFPAKDYNFRNIESVSRFDENKRIETLSLIRKNDYNAVIITADALCSLVMPPDEYKEFIIERDGEYAFDSLPQRLVELGYERFATVEGPGQFSVRGGILDVFPPSEEIPYRIEFFGDEVDSISVFDINTQRRTETKDEVKITPAKEHSTEICQKLAAELEYSDNANTRKDVEILKQDILPSHDRYLPAYYGKKANILDYAADDTEIYIFDYAAVRERINGFVFRLKEDIETLLDEGFSFLDRDYYFDLESIIDKIDSPLIFETLPCSVPAFGLDKLINIQLYPTSIVSMTSLKDEIQAFLDSGNSVTVLANDRRHAASLYAELGSHNGLTILDGVIPYGYNAPDIKTVVYSYKNFQSAVKSKLRKPKYERGERIKSFADIKIGDFVVHTNYGVGVYDGIHKVESQGVTKDFIKIKFAGTDVLYIPCDQLSQISKYIGGDSEAKVKLNKLGGTDWQKTKQRVKKAVKDLAKQLIALYGQRAKLEGHAFSPDTEWQRDFEANFEFEETEDQLRCIDEIKKDMESTRPMDRLLCGDVGFGKTEVALRAIFKCVMDGKQVAVLAPTTILAFQHYNTMLKRFYGFPIEIELLSRFRTGKQQEAIVSNLKKGKIDIVVGTHRLVQKDIKFKDLGLVVIDEEQRFGVEHKEFLKEQAKNVDFLTLSATPIPRTLNMSLSGIRDISMLNEAPRNRFPVTTYVAEYDIGIISDAIKREIARGGQCFYLHNRIDTIYKTADMLQEKTGVRTAVAHGQMSKDEIAAIWDQLVAGEIDLLVCTTIIETGVDIPNCNTLIIEDADKMGLAQLHQIRGRVGRTDRRAYAYFMFKRGKTLSQDAYKRLMTIKEFTEFGSGLKIAMRDLEIRGAGDILGAEQSGHLVTVGFDMYMKLLEEAVSEEKGVLPKNRDCEIDVKINAYIPDTYISDMESRIEIYKMISGIESEDDFRDVLDEIIDRYGEPPHQVMQLLNVALIRANAIEKNVCSISEKDGKLLFFFAEMPDLQLVPEMTSKFKGKVMFSAGTKPYFTLKFDDVLKDMHSFIKEIPTELTVTNGAERNDPQNS